MFARERRGTPGRGRCRYVLPRKNEVSHHAGDRLDCGRNPMNPLDSGARFDHDLDAQERIDARRLAKKNETLPERKTTLKLVKDWIAKHRGKL